MRHTFYTEDFPSFEHAISRAKELVDEIVGDPNPCFAIEEGDAGYCVYHVSDFTSFTGKKLELRVLVYSSEVHGLTVEGFITD